MKVLRFGEHAIPVRSVLKVEARPGTARHADGRPAGPYFVARLTSPYYPFQGSSPVYSIHAFAAEVPEAIASARACGLLAPEPPPALAPSLILCVGADGNHDFVDGFDSPHEHGGES